MGRKGRGNKIQLQHIGGTPSFIQKIKNNLHRQNMESQKQNFSRFLDKAGYEGLEKDQAMARFMENYDDPDIKQKIIHDIEDKNEESKLMRAGFNIMENQKEVLDERARKEELAKFVPELDKESQFAEIGNKKDTNFAKNLKKNKKPIFISRKNKKEQQESEEITLGKRVDTIQSKDDIEKDKVLKKKKLKKKRDKKKKKISMLSFGDDE